MFTLIFLNLSMHTVNSDREESNICKQIIERSVTFHYFALESRRIYVPHELIVSGIKVVDSSG